MNSSIQTPINELWDGALRLIVGWDEQQGGTQQQDATQQLQRVQAGSLDATLQLSYPLGQ